MANLPRIDQMTKEEIRNTIIKRRECNARAQTIVESLLEIDIKKDYFIKILSEINQSHFDDVIEERSIILLCGYPLCSNKLNPKNIPKQQYRISTRSNKVYNIQVRKQFCSNFCYEAAIYIRNQMFTSPLWFRDQEEIPKFELLNDMHNGIPGEEIDISFNEKILIKTESFSSVYDFADASLKEIPPNLDEESGDDEGINLESKSKEAEQTSNPTNVLLKDIVEKCDNSVCKSQEDNKSFKKSENKSSSISKTLLMTTIAKVEQCLQEWFTIDTIIYIYGQERVDEILKNKGDNFKKHIQKRNMDQVNNYEHETKYRDICRKLNLLDMEDLQFDSKLQNSVRSKPLPDYNIIKKEGKKLELKVKAYYAGSTDVPFDDDVENSNCDNENRANITHLPLVDKNAQKTLRKRIVVKNLKKTLEDIFLSLGLSPSSTPDLKLLVNTFELKANNISFNPFQWYYIGLLVFELFSMKENSTARQLSEESVQKQFDSLLSKYSQEKSGIKSIISKLLDIERILEYNVDE